MKVIRASVAACALVLSLVLAPAQARAETSEEVRAEVANVQAELNGLTQQIDEGEAHLADLEGQIESLASESIELERQIITDRNRLAEIVSNSYKDASEGRTLALLLSSQTVDELISNIYYAQKVSDWEADCIATLNDHKDELAERMSQISQAKDEQQNVLDELASQREELDTKVAELSARADELEAQERAAAEAARKAAEEAARKAEEERLAQEKREAEERARQEAIEAAKAAGDIPNEASSAAPAESTPTESAPTGTGWITCIASAYTIADNDPPGSTATASGIPLDESVPTVAMPMSMNPSRFYGQNIEISYNGISVIAMVTDCGYMGGGSRGLDLTPAIFRAFGFSSADDWGLRSVSYRFL